MTSLQPDLEMGRVPDYTTSSATSGQESTQASARISEQDDSGPAPRPPAYPPPNQIDHTPIGPKKPNHSFGHVVKRNPRDSAFALILAFILVGTVVGWIVFGILEQDPEDHEGSGTMIMTVHVAFALSILVALSILLRHAYHIRQTLFRRNAKLDSGTSASATFNPITPGHPIPLSGPQSAPGSFLPPWLLPRLPTYRDATSSNGNASRAGSGPGTGDVEDGEILRNEGLPQYGDVRGSRLLLRSLSRAISSRSTRSARSSRTRDESVEGASDPPSNDRHLPV